MVSSGLRNVRGRSTTITIAAAFVITLLFLPLTSGINNNALLQSQSVFAQQQEGGGGAGNATNATMMGAGNATNATTTTNDTTTEPIDFLPYQNPVNNIFMQYPSNWIASTSGLADYTDLIAFHSPLQNLSDSFPARLTISVRIYDQNISLPEYTDFVLTILNQSEQVDVRSSSEVTISGYPGHRVDLTNPPSQNSTFIFNQMNTWTTIGNKVYLLTYEGEESMFNQYLPEVSQMLDSLSIASNNNNITTTTRGD